MLAVGISFLGSGFHKPCISEPQLHMKAMTYKRAIVCTATALVSIFLLLPASGSSSDCRGVTGNPSGPTLNCAGACSSGGCTARVGTTTWGGYKICNCGAVQNPDPCCQLAFRRVAVGSTAMELVSIGDCISCGTPTGVCSKVISTTGGNWSPLCVIPAPPGQ